ncbi:MAG: type III pantothenate kinase [Candidatus Omnitrophica bacterium]|nr:type III pantothenate kinase [Candidatus Omnitrophota bacterium]
MLLTIDIGNTNISFGLWTNGKLARKFDLDTKKYTLVQVKRLLKNKKPDDVVICSVVPQATRRLELEFTRWLGKKIKVIGKNLKIKITNRYRQPKQVGQDRLVNAFAATALYGSPLIVIDLGTAVTFDIISGKKEYLGGMILPGLAISLESLCQRTALLPQVKVAQPKEFIGRDTRNSMLSGVIYGFASLTDDLCRKIRAKIGKNAKVIGTGGNIRLLARYCHSIDKIDQDLTLKGLYLSTL